MRTAFLGVLCSFWGAFAVMLVATGVLAYFDVPPEPIAPPFPEDVEYIRVWSPKKIAALDELIHADACAGKHWKLPKGYFARDGWIWREIHRMPKSWAAQNLAGCLEVGPDQRQFNRKSYMVPLDTYERYETRLNDQ